MPAYEYSAITAEGKTVKGTVEADNTRAARQKLRSQNIFPTDLREASIVVTHRRFDFSRFVPATRVSTKDLAFTTRQFATLVGSGLPLVSALQALSEQTDSAVMKKILIEVKEAVEEGSSLSRALGHFPKSFPRIYVNMVASGEASGTLDTVLSRLADYIEALLALRSKVRSALIYPILMLLFCAGVIIGLFVFVIPNIVDIFVKQGATLPLPTQLMLALSGFIISYWWLILLLVLLTPAGVYRYYQTAEGRWKIDQLLLKLPLFGDLYLKNTVARMALTLSALQGSGVQLLTALEIAEKITSNVLISKALEATRDGVREGRSLANELKKTGLFPGMLVHMVAAGEKSGQLESMLEKAGQTYEREVNSTINNLTSLLEPLMMVIVGGIVFCIVISVLLPMADLISVIQK